MKLGLDLDGVLYPWHYSIYRYFCENKGITCEIGEFWDKHRDQITEYHVSMAPLYLDTTPTQDVLTYVPKLAELGDLYYVTARHTDLTWATMKFFKIYDLPFKENLIFSADKDTYCRLLGLDYFLDDNPTMVSLMQGITDAYLFEAVHNRHQREGFKVIKSLREFYQMLRSKHEGSENSRGNI